jgi:hypothetical protein
MTSRRRQCRLPVAFFMPFRHMLKHFFKTNYTRFQPDSLQFVVLGQAIITLYKMCCSEGVVKYSDDQEGGHRRDEISHK